MRGMSEHRNTLVAVLAIAGMASFAAASAAMIQFRSFVNKDCFGVSIPGGPLHAEQVTILFVLIGLASSIAAFGLIPRRTPWMWIMGFGFLALAGGVLVLPFLIGCKQ